MGVHSVRLRDSLRQAYDRAMNEALKSVETFRLGAAVVRRRRVVATGRNKNHNSCGLSSIHAEMDAVFKCPKHHKAHVVVVRVMSDESTTGLSRPCDACTRALRRMGVHRVTYTTGDPARPLATMWL